jgi:ATP-dependent Clp protease adaptor protein ClpS
MTAEATEAKPAPVTETHPAQPWLWSVVLLDDNEHTYDYVIDMMQRVFGFSAERAFQIARTVDTDGRAVCFTTHKEHAELKRDQIVARGPDPLLAASSRGMKAIIEPAAGA